MDHVCGDEWKVQFEGEEPITYTIPRILSEDTIQRVKDRLQFNRTSNRTDVKDKYVLQGFLRCEACGHAVGGVTLKHTHSEYPYYAHRHTKLTRCKAFAYILCTGIEKAVSETIFENIVDIPRFEKAIAESMPDKKMIAELELKIKNSEKELKRIGKELDKLVESVLKGTLSEETIKNKEQELIQLKIK
jgi:hypothetical protein